MQIHQMKTLMRESEAHTTTRNIDPQKHKKTNPKPEIPQPRWIARRELDSKSGLELSTSRELVGLLHNVEAFEEMVNKALTSVQAALGRHQGRFVS